MLLLYEHPVSSYAQKVKIALREKGVPFGAELPEDLGTGRTDTPFAAANPRAEVPVLIDGPTRIFESTVIMEYVEERWPDPRCCRAATRRRGPPRGSRRTSATPSTRR